MQVDLAEQLHSLNIQQHDICSRCKDFKETVQHNYSTMLTALGEYRDLSLSKVAPPAPKFPRPEIPPRRPGKRVHGFMSLREPLVNIRVLISMSLNMVPHQQHQRKTCHSLVLPHLPSNMYRVLHFRCVSITVYWYSHYWAFILCSTTMFIVWLGPLIL